MEEDFLEELEEFNFEDTDYSHRGEKERFLRSLINFFSKNKGDN